MACEHRAALGECSYGLAPTLQEQGRIDSFRPLRAARQHGILVRLLERLGAEIEEIPFVHGALDSVFIKDSALLMRGMVANRALLTQPLDPERRREQAARAAGLESAGFQVMGPPDTTFEGGDVVVHPRGTSAFLGYGVRSSHAAAPILERFLDTPVVPLEMRDPSLHHLDMILTILQDGTAVVCREALTELGAKELERAVGAAAMLCVSPEEAREFAVNLIEVGNNLVTASLTPRVHARLCDRGYRVHMTRLDEFHVSGGSASRLVAGVHDQRVSTRAAGAAHATHATSAA